MTPAQENKTIEQWLNDKGVVDVEVIVSDFAGISRGKKLPVRKFINSLDPNDLRMPDAMFGITVDCDFIGNEFITELETDVYMIPDPNSGGLLPWCSNPTAYFICDVIRQDGTPLDMSPRQVLKNVIQLFANKGWQPIIAPEFEFTLFTKEDDDKPTVAQPPRGRSGRLTTDKGVLSVDGISEFGPLFDDVQRYCESMNLPVEALIQEAGVGQFEFNVEHGMPLTVADTAFQFKRMMKWAAIEHDHYASFMAKPYPDDFGNAMHIHQSVVDIETGLNVFADEDNEDTPLFHSYIAGLQKYTSSAMLFFAPYSNSYLRLAASLSSPVNTHWGRENRSVGLRVPAGGREARRVENRILGSDVNPYLAIAGSLLCGYLGMVEGLKPSEPVTTSAYGLTTNSLPQHIYASVEALENWAEIRELLGEEFITTYLDVKKAEMKARAQVLSPWDTEYLLTNV